MPDVVWLEDVTRSNQVINGAHHSRCGLPDRGITTTNTYSYATIIEVNAQGFCDDAKIRAQLACHFLKNPGVFKRDFDNILGLCRVADPSPHKQRIRKKIITNRSADQGAT